MNKRMTVLVGVLIVGAVVAFIALRGYPPTGNTAGTIGAAQRYQAQPMTDSDVQLSASDAQAFLQSDLFHKLATNPSFRQEVKNGDIGKLYGSASFSRLMDGNHMFADMLVRGDFIKFMKDGHVESMARDADMARMLANPSFGKLLDDAGFRSLLGNRALAIGRSSHMGGAGATNFAKGATDAARLDQARADAARYDAARTSDEAKAEAARVEMSRLEAQKVEASKVDLARAEYARLSESARVNGARAEAARAEAARLTDASKTDASRLDEAKAEASRYEAARVSDEAKAEAARAEAARLNQAKAEQSKLDAAKLDESRYTDSARLNQARAEAARAEAMRYADALKLEASRVTDASKVADASRVTDASKVADASRVTDASKVADDSRVTDASKIADESRVTDAGRIVADQLQIDAARLHGDQKQIDQAKAELAMLRTNADFQRLAGADGFAKLINSADAAAIVGNAKLVDFLRSTDYQSLVADGQRATDLASVMGSDSFRGAIDNASFTEMLKVDGMRDALVSDALRGTAMHYSDQMVQAVDGLKLSE